jgi:hypothetical protein
VSIPTKAPGNYEIIAPIDSWMMPPPGNGMMAPGSWGLLTDILLAPETASGQEFGDIKNASSATNILTSYGGASISAEAIVKPEAAGGGGLQGQALQ